MGRRISQMNRGNPLKLSYGLVLKSSCVLSLTMVILLMVLFPRFDTRSDKGGIQTEKPPVFSPPTITKIELPENKQPALPVIPIESPDDEIEVDLPEVPDNFYELRFPVAPPPPPPVETRPRDGYFPIYEEEPKPIGGLKALQQKVKYPELAKELGLQGMVVIRAFINKHGDVEDCSIVKGIPNSGLNEAAIAAVKATKFKPAMQRDLPVGVYFSIPIIFKLN